MQPWLAGRLSLLTEPMFTVLWSELYRKEWKAMLRLMRVQYWAVPPPQVGEAGPAGRFAVQGPGAHIAGELLGAGGAGEDLVQVGVAPHAVVFIDLDWLLTSTSTK